jgi:conjugative transfer signal peptidase TraF
VITKRCLTLALFAAAFALPSLLHHTLLHVVTPSIPPGWYFVERFGSPHVGEYVVTCLPASIALSGLRRGYLMPGDCPSDVAPLVKVLAAAAGDTVTISPDGVFVNGNRAAASPASRDSRGIPLFPHHFGTYRIQAGTVFLLGTSTHSWDSRYFGALSSQSIIGRAHPLIINPSAVPQ